MSEIVVQIGYFL